MGVKLAERPGAQDATSRLEPLEAGDRLGAAEFMRRYEAMPHIKKGELIEGVVHMPSPVRIVQHAAPDGLIQTWLGSYAAHTPGVQCAANATVLFDRDNVPQPDALLRVLRECGGNAEVNPNGYLEGAPELVVEIAASSASIDLHDKLRAYRRNGVKEYLVWRTVDGAFDWLLLRENDYEPNEPDHEGILHSAVFPGLALKLEAVLEQDAAAVLSALAASMARPEHGEFVRQLAERRSAAPS